MLIFVPLKPFLFLCSFVCLFCLDGLLRHRNPSLLISPPILISTFLVPILPLFSDFLLYMKHEQDYLELKFMKEFEEYPIPSCPLIPIVLPSLYVSLLFPISFALFSSSSILFLLFLLLLFKPSLILIQALISLLSCLLRHSHCCCCQMHRLPLHFPPLLTPPYCKIA